MGEGGVTRQRGGGPGQQVVIEGKAILLSDVGVFFVNGDVKLCVET